MVEKKTVKSCCGKRAIVLISTKPILKVHIPLFTQHGFILPENYIKSGIFLAKKSGITVTGSFGVCNLNVRCNGSGCDALIAEFEAIVARIEMM